MERHPGCKFLFRGFVFDPESGELIQNGTRVRLGKQSADVLAALVQSAGQLVTRTMLRELLWPGGEVVNHEKIINNAVSRLRYTFKDDAQVPTFIECVPKRGYRWIMPVERNEPPAPLLQQTAVLPVPQVHAQAGPVEVGPSLVPAAVPSLEDWKPPDLARSRFQLSLALLFLLLLVAGGALFARQARQVAPPVADQDSQAISLAVAPLDALGPDANELAQSFRLDLTDALAQLPKVQVRSTHSLDQLRLKDVTLPKYSTKLGLDVILFGTFRRNARRCDLQLELVRVRDSIHLATFHYTAQVDQLGEIRDTLQRDISTRLRLSGKGTDRLPGSTTDSEAYEAYLQARYQFSLQSSDALAHAIQQYNIAVERDHSFAQAYVGLAQAYLIAALHNNLMPAPEALNKASDAVKQAQALHDSSAEVHSILGFIRFYRDWDLAGGILEEQEAIRMEPHRPIYRQWLAVLLNDKGQYSEALSQIALAQADDPYWPSLYVTEAYISSDAMNYRRLMAAAHHLNELVPNSPGAVDTLANALWYSGQPLEAIAEWRRLGVMEHDPERVAMEDRGLAAYKQAGVKGYAGIRVEELANKREVERNPNDFQLEEWYLAAGQTDRAIESLKRRALAHDPSFIEMATGREFRVVSNKPAFRELLQQTGLAQQLTLPVPSLKNITMLESLPRSRPATRPSTHWATVSVRHKDR